MMSVPCQLYIRFLLNFHRVYVLHPNGRFSLLLLVYILCILYRLRILRTVHKYKSVERKRKPKRIPVIFSTEKEYITKSNRKSRV